MTHGMLGQSGIVGQNGTGQNGTIPSYDALPMPWFVLPHAHSTYENFSDEIDSTVLARGS